MEPTPPLGIIAGNRSLPLLFAKNARDFGVPRLVAAAFEGETDPKLAELVDEIVWLKVGQLNKLIQVFTQRNIVRCVMVGQIAPKNLFDLRPDIRAASVLFRLKRRNAHTIFGAIADELRKDGVELIEATPWLKPMMPGAGFRIGRELSSQQLQDVEFGMRIAKEISRLEIGQTVVVKNGTVLAVEGFEGTDECLRRGGALAGKSGNAIAVKVAKEKHDLRFDIPCVGPRTAETCAQAGITVLAIESEKTLLLDQPDLETAIRKSGMTLATA
jgi:UDP-2,3-diacylglucosamine hydrolase